MVELRGVLARGLKLGRLLAADGETSVAEAMRVSNQFED